jgi:trk system potassium uptake protein TrkH
MLIGGSPGSAAGGIKTSTAFLVLLQIVSRRDSRGEIGVFDRKLGSSSLSDALLFAVRALCLLVLAVFLLLLFESGSGKSFAALAFESFSAFGTVGLSMGATAGLSAGGKLVIMATMFIGRVGLISLASRDSRPRARRVVDYPQGEVLIG